MANYLTNNERFHVFSKSPISNTMLLSQAQNKSGHTIQSSEVWVQDIPAFLIANTVSEAIKMSKGTKVNDLIEITGNIYKRNKNSYNENDFYEMWESISLSNGDILMNNKGDQVLKYHKNVPATLLDTFQAATITVNDTLITQFVSPTDKMISGYPSNGYKLAVFINGEPMSEGESDDNYISNYYAGIVQFNKSYESTKPNFTVNFFEYIGKCGIDDLYNHISTSDIHVTTTDKTSWNNNVTITNNHISNDDIHITSDERTSWDDKISKITEGDNFIKANLDETSKTVTLSLNSTDNIIDDSNVIPTSKAIYDSIVAKTDWEKIINTGQSVTKNTDLSGTANRGNYGGFCFSLSELLLLQTIKLKNVYWIDSETETQKNCYIKIFTQDALDNWILIASSPTVQSEIIQDSTNTSLYNHVWNVQNLDGSDFIVQPNKEYHVTLNDNNNIDSYTAGYSLRLELYQSNSSGNYVLSSELTHKDTSYNANVEFNGIELVKETGEVEKMSDEFYAEFLKSKHDISFSDDKKNDIVSFQDGLVTTTDGKNYNWDIQTATIGRYTFRQKQKTEQEPSLISFNKRKHFNLYINDGNYRNDFYYEYDVFNTKYYDNDLKNGVPIMSTLQNITNGSNMFIRCGITEFNDDLSCLTTANQMFAQCSNLSSFRSALPSLTTGIRMFNYCTSLNKFETKLPHLVLAECMFKDSGLEEINTCLPSLTHAQGMFYNCSNLKKIRFSKNSFQCLYNGEEMFRGCYSLTSFPYELPYLESGVYMFYGCKLDLNSVTIIANSLPDFGSKDSNNYASDGRKHVITFGLADGVADQCATLKSTMENKGWVVEGI